MPKNSSRIEAIGAVDEANAVLGVARLYVTNSSAKEIERIQNDLFDIGADLCVPPDTVRKSSALRVSEAHILRLEKSIDSVNHGLKALDSFILPGGHPGAAHLHYSRTVIRRAERRVAAISIKEGFEANVLKYLNRLSDLLFVLSRAENDHGAFDVKWVPAGTLE